MGAVWSAIFCVDNCVPVSLERCGFNWKNCPGKKTPVYKN